MGGSEQPVSGLSASRLTDGAAAGTDLNIPAVSVGAAAPDLRRPAAPAQAVAGACRAGRSGSGRGRRVDAVAAVLRFYRLGHQGFWFDEGNTALLVHFSPGKMLGLIPQTESTPPLYYCVAWVWARVFGYGETGLRSLSAVCGVLDGAGGVRAPARG